MSKEPSQAKGTDNGLYTLLGTVVNFDNGILRIPSIKTANGNLHQRINQRHEIKRMEEFLTKHPMNRDNCA